MIEFNFAKAQAGAPVITREGRKVRIGIWDAPGIYPIVGIVISADGNNSISMSWTKRGCKYEYGEESKDDLFMVPPELYINVSVDPIGGHPNRYDVGYAYISREDAESYLCPGMRLMKLVEVEEETN